MLKKSMVSVLKLFRAKSKVDSTHHSALIAIIKKSSIFSKLTIKQCITLLNLSKEITLESKEILFQKGDVSDYMYLLIKGQLIATMGGHPDPKIIGSIHVGETVGELGILSEKPRSLTICALEKCQLLAISRHAIIRFWEIYPSAEFHMQMLKEIIERSQSVIKLLANEKLMKHILMIPATNDCIPDDFIRLLKKNIRECHNLLVVDKDFFLTQQLTYSSDNIIQVIHRAEIENKRIIFFIKNPDTYMEFISQFDDYNIKNIFYSIDAIYLISLACTEPGLHSEAKKILYGNLLPFITKKELVLFHEERPADTISNTSEWLNSASYTLHHHVRMNNDKDFQRLIRFIIDMPTGLIISGGGMKAIAALGVIKALEENNIPIDTVGGTSAGATISSLYALYQNYEDCRKAMSAFYDSGAKALKLKYMTYPIISINNGKVINEVVFKLFSTRNAEDLWISNFCMATNLNTCEEVVQNRGLLWENLRSTMSLPFIYPPVIRNGEMYVDGGLLNNLPVDQMKKMIGKEAFTIAVMLSTNEFANKIYHFPTSIPFHTALLARCKLAYKDFVYPPLLDTLINSLLIGSSAKSLQNEKMSNLLIQPDLSPYPILGLKPEKMPKIIEVGYQSTQLALRNLSDADRKKLQL